MASESDKTSALIEDYIAQGKDSLSMVIAGKMGTGKSSLINGVVGRKVAKEGASAVTQTTEIEPYEAKVVTSAKTVTITVWDTPGLGDVFGDDEAVVTQVSQKCKETDLLLYCLDIRQRLTKDDVSGITQLTKKLGPEIWKNAVFALTFANRIVPPPDSDREQGEYFLEIFTSWREAITMVLNRKLSVPREIVENIAIVPTGYRQQSPPDRRDWFTPFWFEAFRKMKENAQPTLLGINLSRMTTASPYGLEADPDEMPIQLTWSETMSIAFEATTEAVGQVGPALQGIDAIKEVLDKLTDEPKYKKIIDTGVKSIKYGYGILIALINSIQNYQRKKEEYIGRKRGENS